MYLCSASPVHSARPVLSSSISTATLLLSVMLFVQMSLSLPAVGQSDRSPSNVRSSADFIWRQSSRSAISPGKNSLDLNPCPPGVLASEPAYYVNISGAGDHEAVRVTGGTCKGDGKPGTIEFVAAKSHGAGDSVGSASSGIQEASIAARFVASEYKQPPQSGRVIVTPGEHDIFAPISIRASSQTVDFSGSVLNCYSPNDACIFAGDAKSSTLFSNITLLSPRGRPMMVAGTKPFIEVNGQQTRIFNVSTRWPPQGGSFGSYVQVDDDQAFLLDGLETALGGSALTCNPTYCGAFISAPGPFNHWSAVGWLKNLNISLQCAGKGVEWLSGNSLKISDSVIQGWSVFGVRVSNQRGGYSGLIVDNVYFEASPACKQHSPYGNVGSAAIIAEGAQVKISGLTANSATGVYPNWGADKGPHDWLYWVVPVSTQFGDGVPLPGGYARTDGSSKITGIFPKIPGASGYKILKRDWDGGSLPQPYPQGTGNFLLTTVQQSSCAALTCSFTDNGGSLSKYSNAGESATSHVYMPRLDFWPGAIVLSPGEDVSSERYMIPNLMLQADVLKVGAIVTTQPAWAIAGEATTIVGSPSSPPAAANIEALHTNGLGPFPGATIMTASNVPQQSPTGHKGRLNFGYRGQAGGFTPVITLADSNWGKTWATSGHRPPADANDLDLGYEGNIDTLYSRAQNATRTYIGKIPDGKPQEDLTASAKTFNVPVTINGDLKITGKCAGCNGTAGVAGSSLASSNRPGISVSAQKSAIAAASLCAPSSCGPGQYRVTYYLDSISSCTSPGNASATLAIGWKDESSARSLQVPLSGNGVLNGKSLSLGQATSFASGDISIWSAGGAAITYSTAYVPCTNGEGSYALRIAVERLQ